MIKHICSVPTTMTFLSACVVGLLCVQALLALPIQEVEDTWENSGKYEGDIVLENGKNGIINPARHWPNNELVYELDAGFDADQVAAINAAFDDYAANTCVRMRPREAGETAYVHIQGSDSGCYSSVGRVGARQTLNYAYNTPGTGCFRHGTLMHELLHALGFYHQQSASDRDDFVIIHYENIEPGKENNFNKYPNTTVTDYGVKYDYGSVMHYSSTAFSVNGEVTIEPIPDPDVPIGQRVGLSASDILKLNAMYPC